MRIKEFYVDGFGIFEELILKEIPERLGVFLGPNEAGKSTLMLFVRSILFGFEDRRSNRNRYEPLRGGRHGGSLLLVDHDGRGHRVERTPGKARGDVVVHRPDGGRGAGEGQVQSLLGGVSPSLYQNVFAFGLTELETLDTLQDDEISGHIYSAGLGLGDVSIIDVDQGLQKEMGDIFKIGGQNPRINALLRELEILQDEIDALRQVPSEYNAVRRRLRELDEEIAVGEADLATEGAEVRWLEKLSQARSSWLKLIEVRGRLEDVPEIDVFPESGVARLESLTGQIEERKNEREEREKELRILDQRLMGLEVDQRVLDHASQITSIAEGRSRFLDRLDALPPLEVELEQKSLTFREQMRSLGPAWDEERVEGFDMSLASREEIRSYKAERERREGDFDRSSLRAEQRQTERDERLREVEDAKETWEALELPVPPTNEPLAARERALAEATKAWNDTRRLEQQLDHVQEREQDLIDQARRLEKEMDPESPVVPLSASWFAIGVGLLAGVLLGAWGQALGGVSVGLIGLGLGWVLYRWRVKAERRRDERSRAVQEEVDALGAKLTDVRRQCDETKRALQLKQGILKDAARVVLGRDHFTEEALDFATEALGIERRAVQKKLALQEAYEEKRHHFERAVRVLAEAVQARKTAELHFETHLGAWNEWLKQHGFEPGLSPDGALEVLRAVERAGEMLRSRRAVQARIDVHTDEINTYERRVGSLFEACSRLSPVTDRLHENGHRGIAAAVVRLADELSEAQENLAERERLRRERQEIGKAVERLSLRIAMDEKKKDDLLMQGGTREPETFRRRERDFLKRRELLNSRNELERQLDVMAAPDADRSRIEEELQAYDEGRLHEKLMRGRERESTCESTLAEMREEKGELRKTLADLEVSRELADKLQQKALLEAKIDDEARQWSIRALCRHFLERARERHERERQPTVIRHASEYFRAMTGGRFVRVLSPVGEKNLYAERPNGERLPTNALSRGTAEQLYLCMRFALVREYAARSVTLPVIMDDVFVNFDPERLRTAMKVVEEVSRHHQVLLFTCHPHVADAAKEVVAGARIMPVGSTVAAGEAQVGASGWD